LGKNIYKKLYSLFKTKALIYKAIQLINKATLEYIKDKKYWNTSIFTKSDIIKVLKYIKAISEPRELVFKPLLANNLKAG
jgi:hypothetical protein